MESTSHKPCVELGIALIQHKGGANLIHQCQCFSVGTEDGGAFC
jgi:hypothetical protein